MMRKIILIFICSLTPLFIFSQKEYSDSISSALRILKVHESSLQKLSPFDDDGMENIERLNRKVEGQLFELLRHQSAMDLPKDTIPFFSVQSSDKKFAVFSWEENLGGSFRSFLNIFYWENKNGETKVQNMTEEFASYNSIFQFKNNKKEVLYLLIGGGISCNTCGYEKVLLLKTKEAELEEVFSYQIDYRFNNDIKGLNYDEKNKVLSYEYIEEDCEEEEGENCWVRGKFQFDGMTFKEIDD